MHSRPGDLFGQFSLDLHLGRSHPERASLYHGTKDRSVHPRGLSLPRNSVGLPDLPTGMMNVTAKAGDILVRQRRKHPVQMTELGAGPVIGCWYVNRPTQCAVCCTR